MNWAAEHVVGVAQGAPEDIIADLRANFEGECSEVGKMCIRDRLHDAAFLAPKYLMQTPGQEYVESVHQAKEELGGR